MRLSPRSRAELEHILGREYRGVLSSDDFSVYNGYAAHVTTKMFGTFTAAFFALSSNSRSSQPTNR